MGRIFVVELEGRTYKCKFCKTQLALADDLVSRAFHCRRGKAYLFTKAVNITLGASEERLMLSGMHTVADIYCCCCGQIVGWKYQQPLQHHPVWIPLSRGLERSRFTQPIPASNLTPIAFETTEIDGSFAVEKEAAHEKSQKYKEGKFVLERGRIVDGLDTDFYIDARPMSDAEDA